MVEYGDVVSGTDFLGGIAEHVDIPQSDAGIIRKLKWHLSQIKNDASDLQILDLGCGPARLTGILAETANSLDLKSDPKIIGVDASNKFIETAKSRFPNLEFRYGDFLQENVVMPNSCDVIVMQGVYHHIELSQRVDCLNRIKNILKDGGVLILGDEFIPEYASESDRVLRAAGLYAYVIANAIAAGNKDLADIEAKNLVDDVCYGLDGAGYSDENLHNFIYQWAPNVYQTFNNCGFRSPEYNNLLRAFVGEIKKRASDISLLEADNHDRGDYKISIDAQIKDLNQVGFKVESISKYGPVDWIGGMGVVTVHK